MCHLGRCAVAEAVCDAETEGERPFVTGGIERREGERSRSQLVARTELDDAQEVAPVVGEGHLKLVPGCCQ